MGMPTLIFTKMDFVANSWPFQWPSTSMSKYLTKPNHDLKVTTIPLILPYDLVFFSRSHSSLHKNKHFVYADCCVIKKDILLAVVSGYKLQGSTAD